MGRVQSGGRGQRGSGSNARGRGAARGTSSTKKKRAAPRRGILGAPVGGGSSDDDDYMPASVSAGASRSRGRRARARPAAAAASDSDSGETLGARKRRLAAQRGADPTSTSNAGPKAGEAAGAVPTLVLSQVFALACAAPAGALPTACRLARVCRAWRDAVNATPEVWRVMDARGRRSAEADKWLQRQAAAGRFRELEDLTIGQVPRKGAAAGEEDEEEEQAEEEEARGRADAGTSADALAAFARHCPRLARLTLWGSPAIHASALEAALMSSPSLQELRLREVRLQPHAGLDKAISALLAAAWGGGRPLRVLDARRCPLLGAKTLRMLCHGPASGADETPSQTETAAAAAPAGSDDAGPPTLPTHPPSAAAAGVVAAGGQRSSGYPHLKVLDLTGSCVASGLQLNIEALQAACPALEELSLEGVGSIFGWLPTRQRAGAPPGPGWPCLTTLRAGALQQQRQGGMTSTPSAVDDALLLRLVGQSPGLQNLGIRGSNVTPDGLKALVRAHSAAGGAGGAVSTGAGTAAGESTAAAAGSGDGAGGSGSAAAVAAAAASDGSALDWLDVTQSPLCCDDGLSMIGDLLPRTLRVLWAQRAGGAVSDAGLACLHQCEALEELDVSGSSVTDDGLRALLAACPRLREVDVSSCRSLSRATRQASVNGFEALRRHLGA